MSNKTAVSERGTVYTDIGNGQFQLSGSASGLLDTINPGNSYYTVYQGSTVPPVSRQFSDEAYKAHLQNVRSLEFSTPEKWWKPLKDYFMPKWISLKDKVKFYNGGKTPYTYNLGLLKHITGY